MKALFIFLIVPFIFFTDSNEVNFTASTPSSSSVRKFLGISLTDSIDFIRWHLSINNNKYVLNCNYGIGKPNTNGFYNGGRTVSFQGIFKKEKNIYTFYNEKKTLMLIELNNSLLHILNDDNSLMIGTGGWSYTLNNLTCSLSDKLMISLKPTVIKDSMTFQGRTPCGVNGISKSQQCHKLKWYIVLYGDAKKNQPSTYRVLATGFRQNGGLKGKWVINVKDGKIIYELLDENEKPRFHLLKLDDGVLIFTDDKGNLLVGDHDFSYTLNRKF